MRPSFFLCLICSSKKQRQRCRMTVPRTEKRKIPRRLIGLILALVLIPVSLFWNRLQGEHDPEISHETRIPSTVGIAAGTSESPDLIPMYIVGAVARPGIYHIARGSYLYQLVETAGGLEPSAAAEEINLVMQLDSSRLIRIPTREELAADPAAAWLSDRPGESPMIDINHADAELLANLPGIGPATARAIIDYRTENGPFRCIEDIMKVSGIKESRFAKIKDMIRVG